VTRKVFQADFGSQADQMVLSAATNPIHNGGFSVWQRGTSFTSVANLAYAADRWRYFKSGAVVHDFLQSTDVPAVAALVPQATYSAHLDVTTADAALAAGDACFLRHAIEGHAFLPFAQKQFTVGFWVKDTATGVHCIAARNAADTQACVMEYTVDAADTWEYKAVTFPASGVVSVANGWDLTNGIGLMLELALSAGTTYQTTPGAWQAGFFVGTASMVNSTSSTSNSFKLWGVTMGLGTTVAPFWPRSFGEEQALCQRYCYVAAARPIHLANGVSYPRGGVVAFPVPMRTAPTASGVTFAASVGNNGTYASFGISKDADAVYNSAANWTDAAILTISGTWSADL
jgi:hypothetical protein